jgi:hypothetical protein
VTSHLDTSYCMVFHSSVVKDLPRSNVCCFSPIFRDKYRNQRLIFLVRTACLWVLVSSGFTLFRGSSSGVFHPSVSATSVLCHSPSPLSIGFLLNFYNFIKFQKSKIGKERSLCHPANNRFHQGDGDVLYRSSHKIAREGVLFN